MTTREYKILGAASARSTLDEFTVWALNSHSLRDHLMTVMRTIRSYAVAAIADAEILRKYGTELATRQISPNRPFKRRTPAGF